MGEKRRMITLVIVMVAILAMVAAYGAASVSAIPTVAPRESAHASAPSLGNAFAAPTKGSVGAHVSSSGVGAQYAKFGPRSTSGIPKLTKSPVAAQPGCSGNCPMGITDYGLTASEGAAAYTYTFAQSFWDTGLYLGIGTANGGGCLDPDAESLVCFTLQQNLVTHDMYYKNGGEYWTQNVPEVAYDSSCSSPCVSGTYSVTFLDNIWNFSDSKGVCPSGKDTGAGCINPARIVGDGESDCVGTGGQPTFYYCYSPTIYDINLPFTITAATNINYFGCASGDNCVYFYDSIQVGTSVVYGAYFDEVTFDFNDKSTAPSYEAKYVATPLGLPYDFEWVFGGPAGGSGNTIADYGDLQSFYCASGCSAQSNWHSIKNAWSSGYDTAEYVFDVYVIPEFNYRDAAELYFAADDSQTWIF